MRKISWCPTSAKTKEAVEVPSHQKARERPSSRLRLRETAKPRLDELLAMADALHWYALQVPPQKEFVAQVILERYGLPTYVPTRHEWRRRSKFSKEKELRSYAVAPRYVFAGFRPGLPLWFDLFNLPVISAVVGISGTPVQIPAPAMRALLRSTGSGLNSPAAHRFMHTHHEFAEGDLVEVIDGPFAGQTVPVKSIAGNKAKVALALFGGLVDELEVPLEILVAAE